MEQQTKVKKTALNLFQKIQAVANEIKNLEKDMEVGKGSYAYKAISDQAVTLAVKDAEKKHGIVSIPIKQDLINSEILRVMKKSGEESITYVDTIKMTIRIVDLESGEYVDVESFGKGIDPADKGFGKASTYARKYGLLNAYKIATGEDPDVNKSETETGVITPKEKAVAVRNYLDLNDQLMVQTLEYFSVGTFEDLTEKQIETLYTSYKKRNVI